jgi:ferredoxin-type protein NapH
VRSVPQIRFNKKYIRYLRWTSKLVFLLLFVVPIAYVGAGAFNTADYPIHVTSIFNPKNTLFELPITQSPCSIWLDGYCTVTPGTWWVEPFGPLQALFTGSSTTSNPQVAYALFISTITVLGLAAILIVLVGAAFCSWMCPLGSIIDSFDMAIGRFLPKIEAKRAARSQKERSHNCSVCPATKILTHKNGYAATGFMAALVAASAILKFNVFCLICPIGITTRGLFHLKATTYVTSKTVTGGKISVFYPMFIEFIMVIPVVAVLLSLHSRRFWCNKVCPVGATINGISTLNPLIKPKVDHTKCIMNGCPTDCKDQKTDYCGACRLDDDRKCEKSCPAGIKLLDDGSLHRCTKCMECYIACEHDAIKVKLVGKPDIYRVPSLFRRKKKAQKVAA